MPLKFELIFNDSDDLEERIEGEFSDDDYEVLSDFLRYAQELSEAPFWSSPNRGQFEISHKRGGPIEFKVNLPNWADVVVLLHKLRPLLLESEPTSFYRIRALVGRYARSARLQVLLDYQKYVYSGKRDQSVIQIRSNDALLNSDSVLQDYLNGFEYHRDKDTQRYIDSLHQMLPLDGSRVIFVGMLMDKANAIFSLADLIAVIIGKKKAVDFQFHRPDKSQGLKTDS